MCFLFDGQATALLISSGARTSAALHWTIAVMATMIAEMAATRLTVMQVSNGDNGDGDGSD